MRPGRLDRIVYVGPPDQKAREEILNIRTRSMSVEPGFDVAGIARIVSISPVMHIYYDSGHLYDDGLILSGLFADRRMFGRRT